MFLKKKEMYLFFFFSFLYLILFNFLKGYSNLVYFTVYLIYLIFFLGIYFILNYKKIKKYNFLLIPIYWIISIFLFNKINGFGFLLEISVFIYKFNSIKIFGSYILTFFLVMILVIIFKFLNQIFKYNSFKFLKLNYYKFLFILFFLLILVIIYPFNNSNQNLFSINNTNILLVQGNINKNWEYREKNFKKIYSLYKNLSSNNSQKYDLIVWPEYAIATDIFEKNYDKKLKNLSLKLNSTLIVGHPSFIGNKIYDSASIFSKGKYISTYNSISPVIFNEGTIKGNKLTIVNINGRKFGIIICYEEFSKEIFKEYKKLGVVGIISIVNEQQIENSWGQKLISKFINLRANEFSLSIFRSTNTGITKIVNSNGNTIKILKNNKQGTLNYP